MADEGAVAVAEAPVVDSSVDTGAEDFSADGSQAELPPKGGDLSPDDKQDGRRQPDALRKRISDMRRQADSIADPAEKAALLSDAKALNDTVGKGRAYEGVFPTVREARESKALIESFGGRDGLAQAQTRLSEVQRIDKLFESGDPEAAKLMWKDAPEGMAKLAPVIFSELEKANPQEYAKAVVPHAVKFFDNSGFPEAFDQMVGLYQSGDKTKGDELAAKLAHWFASQRQPQAQDAKPDPERERLQRELDERKTAETKQATDRAYNDVVAHAGPVIDKFLRPIVAKLGLSTEQYNDLRASTWKHLQDTRNADKTYQTVANAKYAQGMDAATAYIKSETESRAQEAARHVANFRYGHQLKNGAVKTPNATATPVGPGVTRGKEPTPAEIDYSPKGVQVAKKQGFKDLGDMILAGKAPLKAGGIRQWR